MLFVLSAISSFLIAQNVGIGTNNPQSKLEVDGRVAQMGFYTKVGDIELPISFDGTINNSSWTKVNQNVSVGFSFSNWNDYVATGQQLYVRLCTSWTDGGSNTDSWMLRIKDYDSPTVWYTSSWGNSWSGSSLIHHSCGPWVLASSISCGYNWGSSCFIEASHNNGTINLQIKKAWFELAVK